MINKPYSYFYDGQIRRYIAQFMRVFSGFQVRYNVDRDGDLEPDSRTVPVVYGLPDRVVAARLNNDGVFQSSQVPLISAYMTGISPNHEVRRAPNHTENTPYLRTGDPDYRGVIQRAMGVPYKANIDLHMYASNMDQMLQMKEQILLLFNPELAIQVNDDITDWSYITKVGLESINNDTTFPMGEADRLLVESLSFTFDFWLNFPKVERQSIIEQIITNVKDDTVDPAGVDLDTFVVDENGVV